MKKRSQKSAKNLQKQDGISNSEPEGQFFTGIGLAYISLILAGLMWLLPFLYYLHAYPRTMFYQESVAAILGLCAASLLLTRRYWAQPEIPRIVLLPIGLVVIAIVQYKLGQVVYFDQAALFVMYMLWAMLLIMLGQRLRVELGLPLLATILAVCLLVGAELNFVVGILQHYRIHSPFDSVVLVKSGVAVIGNIGQPNHFANYITLGLVSLGLLRFRWSMSAWLVGLLAAPLLFVLVLSGSRSSWLYLIWMTGLACLWYLRERSASRSAAEDAPMPASNSAKNSSSSRQAERKIEPKKNKSLAYSLMQYGALLMAGFGLMHFVAQIPMLAGVDGTVTTVQRLFGSDVGSGAIRAYLWDEGWRIFTKFPFFGAGFGQFAWQHFLLSEELRDTNIAGLYNNAHNLVLHTAAEMGMAGVLVLLGTLLLWLYQAVRMGERTAYHWWAYSVLAVIGIHSMLEYPLWYANFMGVAALTLGMMDYTSFGFKPRKLGQLLMVLLLIVGLFLMQQMWQGYRKVEEVMAYSPTTDAEKANLNQYKRERLEEIRKYFLMVSLAELIMSGSVDISPDNLAAKLELNERVMHAIPVSPLVYYEAFLLAMDGKQDAAQRQMQLAVWSYPTDFEWAKGHLTNLAMRDPAHFDALLKFALQKYEERKSAVSTK